MIPRYKKENSEKINFQTAIENKMNKDEYINISSREPEYYNIYKDYSFKNESYSWISRANILDNIFRIAYDFRLKRETT